MFKKSQATYSNFYVYAFKFILETKKSVSLGHSLKGIINYLKYYKYLKICSLGIHKNSKNQNNLNECI